MLLDGKRVRVARGDTIHWDEDSRGAVITQYSQAFPFGERMFWSMGRDYNHDDKMGVPGGTEHDFRRLVEILAEVLNLDTEVVQDHKPTYKFV